MSDEPDKPWHERTWGKIAIPAATLVAGTLAGWLWSMKGEVAKSKMRAKGAVEEVEDLEESMSSVEKTVGDIRSSQTEFHTQMSTRIDRMEDKIRIVVEEFDIDDGRVAAAEIRSRSSEVAESVEALEVPDRSPASTGASASYRSAESAGASSGSAESGEASNLSRLDVGTRAEIDPPRMTGLHPPLPDTGTADAGDAGTR